MSAEQLEHTLLKTMADPTTWWPEPPSRRWVLFRRFDIVHDGELYLRRWRMIETPWFGIFLHKIARPDQDRHLHDHPWPFISLVLRGYYIESLPGNVCGRLVQRFNFKRASDAHQIRLIGGGCCWTFVVRGPRERTWGFHTEYGWVPWHIYLGAKEPQ